MRSAASSVALWTLVLLGCAGAPDTAWTGPAPLHGVIYDYAGAPLGWVELRVDDGPPVYSDIHGRFILPPITAGNYRVQAGRAGYETIRSDVTFTSRSDVLYLRLRSVAELVVQIQEALDDGDPATAIELLQAGLPANAEDAQLRFLLALARARTGDVAAALDELEWFPSEGSPAAVELLRLRLGEGGAP